jgi:hydrogenase maturation factor
MCVSRLYKVLGREGVAWVDVEDVDHVESRASLLAYDGEELGAGDWVSVHSGYVIDRVDGLDAARVVEEIRRAVASSVKGDISWGL